MPCPWTRTLRPRGRASWWPQLPLPSGGPPRGRGFSPPPLSPASLLCSEHDVGEDIYDCVPCEDEGDDIYEDIIKVEVQQPMVSPRCPPCPSFKASAQTPPSEPRAWGWGAAPGPSWPPWGSSPAPVGQVPSFL